MFNAVYLLLFRLDYVRRWHPKNVFLAKHKYFLLLNDRWRELKGADYLNCIDWHVNTHMFFR